MSGPSAFFGASMSFSGVPAAAEVRVASLEVSVGKAFVDPNACFGVSRGLWKAAVAAGASASATAGNGCKLINPGTRLTRIATATADVRPERAHAKYRRIRRHTPTHNEGHPEGCQTSLHPTRQEQS
ncbi:hypothetical protein AB0J35_21640 [Nonomuraea angiospora]|uniref:hypothetical protein n=1 Tax=Nonomuraea angiospora TaxID=46172 RepID=UPI0034270046